MAELGLIVNQPEPFLVCTTCEQAIQPQKLSHHLSTKHTKAQLKVNQEKLKIICFKLDIQEHFPPVYPGIKAFKSLPITPGFQCSHCHFSSINMKKIQQHFKQEHSDHPDPITFPKALLQRFQKTPFTVVDTNLSTSPSIPTIFSAVSIFAHNIASTNSQAEQPNARLITPWLLTTNWHKEIKDKDIQELCNEAEYPKLKEFPGLKEAILQYMKHCSNFIEETQDLVLEILNTKIDDG